MVTPTLQPENSCKKTIVYAAFCGTGKSHLCKVDDTCTEIQCWEYRSGNFPQNYVEDVLSSNLKTKNLFISTDPVILSELNKKSVKIILVYPENGLRDEYLDRYIARDDPYDFIGTIMKNWHKWINELKELDYCTHIVLKSNQYLQHVLSRTDFCETQNGRGCPYEFK